MLSVIIYYYYYYYRTNAFGVIQLKIIINGFIILKKLLKLNKCYYSIYLCIHIKVLNRIRNRIVIYNKSIKFNDKLREGHIYNMSLVSLCLPDNRKPYLNNYRIVL